MERNHTRKLFKIFLIQKRVLRIINKNPTNEPLKESFLNFKIMILPGLYIV